MFAFKQKNTYKKRDLFLLFSEKNKQRLYKYILEAKISKDYQKSKIGDYVYMSTEPGHKSWSAGSFLKQNYPKYRLCQRDMGVSFQL